MVGITNFAAGVEQWNVNATPLVNMMVIERRKGKYVINMGVMYLFVCVYCVYCVYCVHCVCVYVYCVYVYMLGVCRDAMHIPAHPHTPPHPPTQYPLHYPLNTLYTFTHTYPPTTTTRDKAVIKKALVQMDSPAYVAFTKVRQLWSLEDCYRAPGPIQFAGASDLCNVTNMTLALEVNDGEAIYTW